MVTVPACDGIALSHTLQPPAKGVAFQWRPAVPTAVRFRRHVAGAGGRPGDRRHLSGKSVGSHEIRNRNCVSMRQLFACSESFIAGGWGR